MIDWILKFEWNGLLGIALYWVPMLFCAVFYTIRTAEGYMGDCRRRDAAWAAKTAQAGRDTGKDISSFREAEKTYYHPTQTIGCILGRALVSATPIANLWAALFDLSPKVFSRLFNWLGRVFDQPLVPPLK